MLALLDPTLTKVDPDMGLSLALQVYGGFQVKRCVVPVAQFKVEKAPGNPWPRVSWEPLDCLMKPTARRIAVTRLGQKLGFV